MTTPSKSTIIALLDRWIRQRPGLEYSNYGDPVTYRAEVRSIGKDLAHARTLLRQVELSGITGEELAAAFPRAYSGRLSLYLHSDGSTWSLDYCTGQYWPTEYRRAACAVLASALWDYKREKCMPSKIVRGTDSFYPHAGGGRNEQSAGDWLRSSFRREFGAIAAARDVLKRARRITP